MALRTTLFLAACVSSLLAEVTVDTCSKTWSSIKDQLNTETFTKVTCNIGAGISTCNQAVWGCPNGVKSSLDKNSYVCASLRMLGQTSVNAKLGRDSNFAKCACGGDWNKVSSKTAAEDDSITFQAVEGTTLASCFEDDGLTLFTCAQAPLESALTADEWKTIRCVKNMNSADGEKCAATARIYGCPTNGVVTKGSNMCAAMRLLGVDTMDIKSTGLKQENYNKCTCGSVETSTWAPKWEERPLKATEGHPWGGDCPAGSGGGGGGSGSGSCTLNVVDYTKCIQDITVSLTDNCGYSAESIKCSYDHSKDSDDNNCVPATHKSACEATNNSHDCSTDCDSALPFARVALLALFVVVATLFAAL